MLAIPFTWSITNGIGAGFVTYAAIASAAFVVYFALPLLERALG